MNVFVHHQFAASRKEQLADMLRRVLSLFADAGLVPTVDASFADSNDATRISAVDRALKKYPELAGFVSIEPPFPGLPATRALTGSLAASPLPLDAVLALAEGVPRSLPFDSIQVQLAHPEFDGVAGSQHLSGGVIVSDSWWVNGRNRRLSAIYTVRSDPDSAELPPPPTAVADLIAGLGKPRKSGTQVIPDATEAELNETVRAARQLVADYRRSMSQLVARAAPPNELPAREEAFRSAQPASGPLKPALVAAFGPRGFDCRGEPGRFRLRRRTVIGNFETLELDVGTWSRMVTAQYIVHAAVGAVRLHVPVGAGLGGALQYPIGDQGSWERIVANIATVVDELARSFLPEIESVLGGSPEWFEPGSPLG